MLTALFPISTAGPGEWTWEAGSRSAGGSTANASQPVARCCSQSWTASAIGGAPKLYLFGGSSDAFVGDFWYLDPSRPRDGWRNIPSGGSRLPNSGGNATIPSARSYAVTWTRVRTNKSDELWMWGGFGCNASGDVDGHLLSDMWSWTVGESAWTPRAQGDASRPGPRNWANFWSVDGGATLYVHSGMGGPLTPWGGFTEPFSDMWRFDVDNAQWTNVYDYTKSAPAVQYGGDTPSPGYRSNAYTADDGASSRPAAALWLYGGEGGIAVHGDAKKIAVDGDFQDVWRFDLAAQRWAHVVGPRTAMGGPPHIGCSSNATQACLPVYGTKGVPSRASLPPAEHAGVIFRHVAAPAPTRASREAALGQSGAGEHAATSAATSAALPPGGGGAVPGAMWLFGGENGSEASGMRNGLWSFDLGAMEWAWQTGDAGYNGSAVYSAPLGTSATSTSTRREARAATTPGGLYAGQGWVDARASKLWIFGGYGLDQHGAAGYLDDTWSYDFPRDGFST